MRTPTHRSRARSRALPVLALTAAAAPTLVDGAPATAAAADDEQVLAERYAPPAEAVLP